MKLYEHLDLPTIPKHLMPDLDTLYKSIDPTFHNKFRTMTRGDEIIEQSGYARFDLDNNDELKTWVDTNITDQYSNIGLSYMYDGPINLPHTDFTERDATLIYLFDLGGDNVETKFWKLKGQDMLQPRCMQPASYNDMELLDTIVLKSHCWNLLNARVIHSVENKTRARVSLQLGFRQDSDWVKHMFV